jgi:alpha-ketoglutarate-dependent taurine dioxygenase
MTIMRRIGGSRPRSVRLDEFRHFEEAWLPNASGPDGTTMPLVLQPASDALEPISAAASCRMYLRDRLQQVGALLFRGCGIDTVECFEAFVGAIAGDAIPYKEQSSPRSLIGGHVYTSTDYPADQPILPHNENSYAHQWPLKIAFFCEVEPEAGGETPIVDVRQVYARLPAHVREVFAQKQILYVRNYADGLGLPWQRVFGTTDRTEVEQYCARAGYAVEWRDNDRLRTRRIAPAIRQHPTTGEAVWFNHAFFFHVMSLPPGIRDPLLVKLREEDWPNHTYFGDGTAIPQAYLDEIRQAYDACTIAFPWRRGDVLLLDNMLVAHARAPFKGARRVLVCMAEPFGDEGAATGGRA